MYSQCFKSPTGKNLAEVLSKFIEDFTISDKVSTLTT